MQSKLTILICFIYLFIFFCKFFQQFFHRLNFFHFFFFCLALNFSLSYFSFSKFFYFLFPRFFFIVFKQQHYISFLTFIAGYCGALYCGLLKTQKFFLLQQTKEIENIEDEVEMKLKCIKWNFKTKSKLLAPWGQFKY